MGSIFDINAEFQSLYEMATDPDCDEQVFNDTLEALTGELSIKAAGYVAVINQLKMESKQADEVSKAFAEKKRVRDNHIKRMNEVLMFVMDQTGIEKQVTTPSNSRRMAEFSHSRSMAKFLNHSQR